eukprot:TRINITY_DN18593_c0_g1_i7.p1 TRINITY_DN18593_c0_g1~~TRINITY_DN18593_c0_g1_i7.p1  ORF type:complete len:283 (+),score=54.77 TRINITY_DN18593_c0_g1_i7:46-894(+)
MRMIPSLRSSYRYFTKGSTPRKDRTIKLWNPHKGTLIKTYNGHGYEVRDVDVSADNGRLASCGGDRQVFLWDVATGNVIKKFKGHDRELNCIRFNILNTVLVTGSYDSTVKIWDLKSNSFDPIQTMSDAKDSVVSVYVSGHEIITGSVDGVIRNYDMRVGQVKSDHIGQPVTSVEMSHDQRCILASSLDDRVRLMDKETGEMLAEYRGHMNKSFKVSSAFTFDDGYVASGSEDHKVCMWDLVEARPVRTLHGHEGPVLSVACHPKDTTLLSASADGTVRVWK